METISSVRRKTESRLRIIVMGYIVRGPVGGLSWHHLQYILGLIDLGHDVIYLEDSGDYPSCYHPLTFETNTDPNYGLRYIKSAFNKLNLRDAWAYYDAHKNQWSGKSETEIFDFISTADILLNISGINSLRDWLLPIPQRIFIDTDPVFTQIRHLTDETARKAAERHNRFFTFGENYGRPECQIPDDGFRWRATRQPVVMDIWKATEGKRNGNWTTVMQWDSYPALEYNGKTFGMKSASFDQYINLPQMTPEKFALAVGSSTAPHELLQSKGWKILDPVASTRTPWIYQNFIQNSKAEWTVAKHGYAVSESGWFSERSAAYLASGRPVVTQETGFSEWLATGAGVLPFSQLEETVAGVEAINSRYEFHCQAAREIAFEYFDSRRVLSHLLDDSMNSPDRSGTTKIV